MAGNTHRLPHTESRTAINGGKQENQWLITHRITHSDKMAGTFGHAQNHAQETMAGNGGPTVDYTQNHTQKVMAGTVDHAQDRAQGELAGKQRSKGRSRTESRTERNGGKLKSY
jgi:hypothetical protein